MSTIERLTITMPAEMLALVKAAVDEGEYSSTSEIIRESLRDWTHKRALRLQEFTALKADIDAGLADMRAGRLTEFKADKIIARGKKLLAARAPTA